MVAARDERTNVGKTVARLVRCEATERAATARVGRSAW